MPLAKRGTLHFNHEQAIEEIKILKPKKTFLTHLSHEVDYAETNRKLQDMCNSLMMNW